MTIAAVPFRSRKRVLARLAVMKNERRPHETDWRNITDYIRPSRGRYLYTPEASRRPTSMINSSPYEASRTLQAGMVSGASSPAYQWFAFTLDDPEMMDWGPAREALEARQKITYKVLANSNFYTSLQTLYGDAADFGTGCAILDEHDEDYISLKPLSPGEYWIDLDEAGDLNALYREFDLTVLQIMTRYRGDLTRISRTVQDCYARGEYQTKFRLVEAIEVNEEFDGSKGDWRGKPFSCLTMETQTDLPGSASDEVFLSVRGYSEWPVPSLRWDVASGNKWGWGPGLVALGDAKALQTYEFRYAQALEKAVTPPMKGPVSLRNRPMSHAPGGMTYVDPFMNGNGLEPLYQMSPGVLNAIESGIARKEMRIDGVYYKDLFLMLATTDRREITAREVEEKHQEKLLALGPVLGRTHRDTLDISIVRAYQICLRRGLFPPAPQELTDRLVGIQYTSALAYAQRASGAASIERFFGFTGQLVAVFPEIKRKVNVLAAMDEYADAIGMPAKTMVSTAEAEKAVQADSAQAAAAQGAETGLAGAQAAKLLSETDTTRSSALSFIQQRAGL